MNKQSSQTLDNVTDSTEIPSTLSAAQGWADKASSTRKGHIESHSELSIESSCFLELAEKTTYQSVELKATVDAALPVVEFLSLDDPVSALALTTDTCHQTHASLESLQLLAVLLSKVIRQLTIETIRATFFLVIRTKESVGATIRVFHADIKLLVSISVVWIHVGDSGPSHLYVMEGGTTTSRLPKPSIPRAFTPWRGQKTAVKKRPLISDPIGPVLHNGNIFPGTRSSTLNCPQSTASLKKTTVITIFPDNAEGQKENITPSTSCTQESFRPRLSKSRTFNVLSNITHSISRASLSSSKTSRNVSANSRASSVTSIASKKQKTSPQPDDHPAPSPPPTNPRFVIEAQGSAYWTGRFVALHDRFHNELLSPPNLCTLMNAHAEGAMKSKPPQRPRAGPPTRLPPSATSAAIMQRSPVKDRTMARQDAELLTDDDIRCRRIFIHLEAMCLTDDARRSLHVWQQTYSTETGRENLLPLASKLENRSSLMGKIFTGKTRGSKRSSFV